MASSIRYITRYKEPAKTTTSASSKTLGFNLDPLSLKDRKTFGVGTKVRDDITKTDTIGDTSGPIAGVMRTKNKGELLTFKDDNNKQRLQPTLLEIVEKMNDTLFIPNTTDSIKQPFIQTVDYYNRFKVANPNLSLQKGFPHVFFVRPNCNLISNMVSGVSSLRDELKSNELFSYSWNSTPKLVKELVKENGQTHDFMMSLSNAAASFSLSEEYINTDTYGKTYTGHKVAYGKHNIESKTAGEFTVTYTDDRNLHIYQLHRLWVEYISGVYRGSIEPLGNNIINKILDYVGACYYILTAEDGETIIFWSKYYGVFPTNIPSTQYSWGAGNTINNPQVDINYRYSFKEDFNPYTILEFNYNSRVTPNIKYIPTYDRRLDHVGATWVGAPFIELVEDKSTGIYEYKLRFKEK